MDFYCVGSHLLQLGGEINWKLFLGFQLKVKILSLSHKSFDSCYTIGVEIAKETSDGRISFVVKNIQNYFHIKIDLVKFDDTNNFKLWRCEVLDVLNAQNLENALEL